MPRVLCFGRSIEKLFTHGWQHVEREPEPEAAEEETPTEQLNGGNFGPECVASQNDSAERKHDRKDQKQRGDGADGAL